LRRAARVGFLVATAVLITALVWRHMAYGLRADGLWYVAEGEWVLQHGALPERDIFCFSSTQSRWLLPVPGSEIGFAWVMDHAGIWALLALTTAAAALGRLLMWVPHARGTLARAAALPLLVMTVVVDGDKISPRGQVFGDIGIAILLIALWRMKRGARVHPLAAVALGALWNNLHPSVMLAIILPPIVALSLLLDPEEDRPPLLPFFVFAGLVALGTGATPYGYTLMLDDLRRSADSSIGWTDVFRSPPLHEPIWILALAVGLVVVGLRMRKGDARQRNSEVLLLLFFVVATCYWRRYGPLLMGVSTVIVGRMADGVSLPSWGRRAETWLLAALAAGELAVAFGAARTRRDPWGYLPVAAVAYIEAHHLPDNVINQVGWGGYLDYAWKGERKAFIDGRNLLFVNGVFDDYLLLQSVLPGWELVLDVYEAGTVLEQSGSKLDQALGASTRWREVFRDRLAVVYTRRGAGGEVGVAPREAGAGP
jgi:hypothetical protein